MKSLLLGLMSLSIISCTDSNNTQNPLVGEFDFFGSSLSTECAYNIKVTDKQGGLLDSVNLFLGIKNLGNNLLTSDRSSFQFVNCDQAKEMLTFVAPGFVRASFIGLEPGNHSLRLNKLRTTTTKKKLTGITTGFQDLSKDGFIDFSLAAPLFKREHLSRFDISYVISNQVDEMSVIGRKVNVPSNLSFPKQKERYSFINVTFDKPGYTLEFAQKGVYRIGAMHGRFPFKKVADQMRKGKSMFGVINDLDFKSIGLHEAQIDQETNQKNLSIMGTNFSRSLDVSASEFKANEVHVGVALNNLEGELFPSDVKVFSKGEKRKLKFASDLYGGYVLGVLMEERKDNSRPIDTVNGSVSIYLNNYQSNHTTKFLPRIEPPRLNGNRIESQLPANEPEAFVLGTYASIKTSNVLMNSSIEMLSSQTAWELYSLSWESSIELPEIPGDATIMATNQLEIMYLGSENDPGNISSGPEQLEKANYATRATVDY
ncbi:MAG: hypothetical protein AB8E15_04285 [Bdellovibrionales bacterium]